MNNHMTTDNEDCSEFGEEAEHVHRKIDLCTRKYKRLAERRLLYVYFSLVFNVFLIACVYFGDRNVEVTYEVIAVSAMLFMASVVFGVVVCMVFRFIGRN